jgi:hypothetical protein
MWSPTSASLEASEQRAMLRGAAVGIGRIRGFGRAPYLTAGNGGFSSAATEAAATARGGAGSSCRRSDAVAGASRP